MQRILTFITQLTRLCLRTLHHRFIAWITPESSSLLLGTLTDLSRSTSELVTENAFLRQQLIILRRQVKRPACMYQDGPHAPGASGQNGTNLESGPRHRSARDASALLSSGLQAVLEVQVPGSFS